MITITRKKQIDRLAKVEFDCLIVGGGATGSGTALDASLRGLNVALIEKNDFAAGTSSKATKLIHGGVRYLAQFHFGLIREALQERKRLIQNVPHLVKPLKFLLPTYKPWEKSYYSIGLTLYDILAGDSGLPNHKRVSKEEAIQNFSSINQKDLTGGIEYYDAGFNDSRLNVLLARTAEQEGACVVNQVELVSIQKNPQGKVNGVVVRDRLTGKEMKVKTKILVNTTGVFIDEVRKLDDPESVPVLYPSQGIHLVFSKEKIPCNQAMIIPKTSDGRVVFLIPWENHVIMGTTDTGIKEISIDPMPLKEEIDFLLKTGNDYLQTKVQKEDILSVFAGLRPLISPTGYGSTKSVSREEVILVSESDMITMSGGKWSTYRHMAEDLTDKIIQIGKFSPARACQTYNYSYIGKEGYSENMFTKIAQTYKVSEDSAKRLKNSYGGEVYEILGDSPKELLKGTAYFIEEVIHFIHKEFALSILDVLSRRFRILFVNLELAEKMIKPISKVMSKELKWDKKKITQEEKAALELIHNLKATYSA
jgi:glycerol-3-phosphate dehydrogenase